MKNKTHPLTSESNDLFALWACPVDDPGTNTAIERRCSQQFLQSGASTIKRSIMTRYFGSEKRCQFAAFFPSSPLPPSVCGRKGVEGKRWLMIFLPEQVPDQLLAFVPRPALVRTSPTFFFFYDSLCGTNIFDDKSIVNPIFTIFFSGRNVFFFFFFNSMKGGSGIKYLSERLRISFSVIFSVSLCCRLQFIGVSLAQQRGAETSPIGRYHSFESYRLKKKRKFVCPQKIFSSGRPVRVWIYVCGVQRRWKWFLLGQKKRRRREKGVNHDADLLRTEHLFIGGPESVESKNMKLITDSWMRPSYIFFFKIYSNLLRK